MSKSILMSIICRLLFWELKRKYIVLLGLADNLPATKQEKTSVLRESIIDTEDDAYSGKHEICI